MSFVGWRGNLLRYLFQPIPYMQHLRRAYGDVACLVRSSSRPVLLRPLPEGGSTVFGFGPRCNRQVLSQPEVFESDLINTPKALPWLGDNMVAANRQDRALQRRTMTPAFTAQNLKSYYDDIVELTEQCMGRWSADERIDLTEEIENLTVAVASKTFYGQNMQDDPDALASIARQVVQSLFSPGVMLPLAIPGSPYAKLLRLGRRAEELILTEISRRRQQGTAGKDVLSIMIDAIDQEGVQISERHLVGNAFALFLAGHDVPANALGFILYLLAQHPAVMADLLDELDAETGGAPPTFDQIWRLPVLGQVIQESLRVLSPAILIWRRLTSPAYLGDHELAPGTEVLLSPYMTHIDPEVYESPKRFLPRRWESSKASPFEYLPFSYGARKCLGAAFSEVFLKIAVSLIVQRFRLELVPGAKVDILATMTMKPKPGLPVVVRRQDRQFHHSPGRLRGALSEMVEIP